LGNESGRFLQLRISVTFGRKGQDSVWQVFDEVAYEKLQVSKKQDGLSVVFTSAYLLAQFADFLIVSQKNMTR